MLFVYHILMASKLCSYHVLSFCCFVVGIFKVQKVSLNTIETLTYITHTEQSALFQRLAK